MNRLLHAPRAKRTTPSDSRLEHPENHAEQDDGEPLSPQELSRRRFMAWSSLAVAAGFLRFPADVRATAINRCQSLPLSLVQLKPSLFVDSLNTNLRYLLLLQPDRLLHNFRQYAGLAPKGPVYGGWENETIAGHTLGHYLSALAKLHAQTGDSECLRRVAYIVGDLALCQQHGGDGYVAGLTRKNADGKIESGRKVFEEIGRGEIRSSGFDLNGSWSPLYTLHKLFAGLLDAHAYGGNDQALQVAVRLGDYIYQAFAGLDDEQVQKILVCEFGGLNESFAELYSRTRDARWLRMCQRLCHHKVIDPLALGHDDLPHLHANTQVPKLIGMARQYEVSSDASAAAAARFFWETVTAHYSYVIGGNADREYFQEPDSTARYLTESTCEHCNSYNMLKLTRHLYQWTPQARYFDYYERTLYNHIMAQQHPRTGMFTYMTPMITAAERGFSDPFDSFWCCVGTGMESHAQFGDSIYWQDGHTLFVNLYIPSRLNWGEREFAVDMESGLPADGSVKLTITRSGDRAPRRLALRIPEWAQGQWQARLNGRVLAPKTEDGYAVFDRRWRENDTIDMTLSMPLRIEDAPGDSRTVSVLRGPLVMAADLGPVSQPYDAPDPTLVTDVPPLTQFKLQPATGRYIASSTRPSGLEFVPFYSQYDRRSALYFQRMDPAAWQQELKRRADEKVRQQELASRAIDMIQFGDDASEKAHGLVSETSFAGSYRRKTCRDARGGGFIEFELRNAPAPLSLRLRYWGSDTGKFRILINGKPAVEVAQLKTGVADFIDRDYPLPTALLKGKRLKIRIAPQKGDTAGPLFGGWLIAAR